MNDSINQNWGQPRVIYTAEFVKDEESLLNKFIPKHRNIFAHHSTIAFKPENLDSIEIGKEKVLKVIGRVYDDLGDAILIEGSKSINKYPHITISCADGVPPRYSNELIERAMDSNSVEYFSVPEEIMVTEGYSDGKNDFIS